MVRVSEGKAKFQMDRGVRALKQGPLTSMALGQAKPGSTGKASLENKVTFSKRDIR